MYRRPGYGYRGGGPARGYRDYGRARDGSGLAVSLLLSLFQQLNQLDHKPPATMGLLALNMAAFFVPDLFPSVSDACVRPSAMTDPASFFFRAMMGAFTHADVIHLYYNMSSLIWKGYQLERRDRYSSGRLLMLVVELVLTSSFLYCLFSSLLPMLQLYRSCAVGFSAVLFGLKVVLHDCETRHHGVDAAVQTASWAELLLGQFFSSQYGGMTSLGSAVGHGCGILAGVIHVQLTRRLVYGRS